MCDNGLDLDGLKAVGLNPIIIDENTVFSEEEFPIELDTNGRPKKTVRNKRSVGARNKAAGHGWEYTIKGYLATYFPDIVTTRGNSKFLDAQKVDFMNKDERKNGFLPFNLQAKMGAAPSLYEGVFATMPDNGSPNIIAFKYTRKAKSKFMSVGEYALMELKTWLYYIRKEKELKELKEWLSKLSYLSSAEDVANAITQYNHTSIKI